MKNRLNNKGFAVSIVVYAILILLVVFMFTILLLYRNTYRNQKDFNDEVKNELNDYLINEFTPEDNNKPSCTLKVIKNGLESYTVNIESSNTDLNLNGRYRFEGESYSNNNTKTYTLKDCPTGTCNVKGYVRDENNNESNACIPNEPIEFDITPPTCKLTSSGSGSSRTLTISPSDGVTDVKGYVITEDSSFASKAKPTDFTSNRTLNVTKSGTYYGYVIDTSNNISSVSTACMIEITIDTIAPTCTLSASGSGSSVTLTINSSDSDLASSGYSFDGTNFSATKTKNVTSAGTYSAYVKDKAGNISKPCTTDVIFENNGPIYLFKENNGFIDGKVISYTDFKPSYGSQGFMKAIVDDTKYIALYHNKTTLYETGRYDSGPSIIIGNLDGTKIDFSKYKKLYFEFENKGYESSSSYTRASYGYTTLDNESNVYCDGASPIGFEKYVFDQTTNRTTKSIDISSVTGNYFIAAAQSSAHNYPFIFPGGVYIYNIWLE